ncbi:nuclear transport factor 2 family protein [Sphingobacterium sp. lm-10]|uniref:nuclear transport factor 2 family protein n=1 Tax=Sphingobacterium sp. lm-10 TaxID=2944904 RepID=UPI002021DD5F|nr:nuclear transport factor 2 family protein [Sphingobacterium sp. lm-10]MCL7989279.1 nuclear transport factor 2 family protein [Sphingobacterium sp. lm-10]
MKKTITSIAAALLMIISFSSFAAKPIYSAAPTASSNTLSAYVSSLTEGLNDFNNMIFAKDFEYRNTADRTEKTFNRRQYMQFLKNNKGLKFDCTTTYQILDETGNTSLAKVTMAFRDFTRVDYVTLHANDRGWKVSKVVTTYPTTSTVVQ